MTDALSQNFLVQELARKTTIVDTASTDISYVISKSGISVINCIKQQSNSSKRSSESEPGETYKKFFLTKYKVEFSCLEVQFSFLMRIIIITETQILSCPLNKIYTLSKLTSTIIFI